MRAALAGLLGRQRARDYGATECASMLCRMRAFLPGIEPEARHFLSFCFDRLEDSKGHILQDLFVLYETGEKRGGYFVDFGAGDGIHGSNSYILETKYGWSGIVAEPARIWSDQLDRNRRCKIDHRCVTDRTGEKVLFRECIHPELSTIDRYASMDRFGYMRRPKSRYAVETVSLNDLLKDHGAPRDVDYLSMDTECSEFMILEALDFDAHRPQIITVEHSQSPARRRLFTLLSEKGYRRKFESLSEIEDWYVRT